MGVGRIFSSRRYFPGEEREVKFGFYSSKLKKQPLFANNFKIQGAKVPLPTPMVAATDMKALCKKQTTLQAVGYLGFPAPGDKLSSGAPTQPVRDSVK